MSEIPETSLTPKIQVIILVEVIVEPLTPGNSNDNCECIINFIVNMPKLQWYQMCIEDIGSMH